jgi:hypothetical protein
VKLVQCRRWDGTDKGWKERPRPLSRYCSVGHAKSSLQMRPFFDEIGTNRPIKESNTALRHTLEMLQEMKFMNEQSRSQGLYHILIGTYGRI